MKRDMDLVRRILIRVEGTAPEELLNQQWLALDEYTTPTVAQHVELLIEAGLVEGHVLSLDGVPPQAAHVTRLTWAGHEFLDATRNDTVWAKTKRVVAEKGGSGSVEVLKAVATKLAFAQLGLGDP